MNRSEKGWKPAMPPEDRRRMIVDYAVVIVFVLLSVIAGYFLVELAVDLMQRWGLI